ncbi:hypothetical protein AAHH59_10145, partial [Pediococcus acidilactici]|uniref:hypothetical protein n=1 Tax=Pediococcus acidilactici TaxID=1254 RepID=UPI0031900572
GGDNWSRDELKGAIVWDASKEVYEKFPSADNKGCFWFSTGKTGKGGELPRIVLVDSPPSAIAHAYLDKVSKISTDINIYIAVDSPKVIPLADIKAVLARGGQVEVGFATGPAGDQMAEYVLKKLPGATRLHSVRGNSWGEQSDLRVRDLSKTVSPVTSSVLNATPKLVSPMQIFQQKIDQVDKQTGNFLASLQPSSPSLDTLRQWYRVARESGKSPQYL